MQLSNLKQKIGRKTDKTVFILWKKVFFPTFFNVLATFFFIPQNID